MGRTRRFRILAVMVLTLLLAALPGTEPAMAGGTWLDPVQDRYEPGETATLVGYPGGSGSNGPYKAYLYRQSSVDVPFHPRAIPLYVGDLEVSGPRVAITFVLPEYLDPGVYWITYCSEESCQDLIGDLIGAWFHVGVDPEYPVSREWPASEPEVQNLADDALLVGPGSERTAAEVRGDAGA